MDEFSGNNGDNGIYLPRKGSSRPLRDSSYMKEQNPRLCSRIGCCGSSNSPNLNELSNSDKIKSSRLPSRSSSAGKEIIGSSSRTLSSINNGRISLREASKKSPQIASTEKSIRGIQTELMDCIVEGNTTPKNGTTAIVGNSRGGRKSLQGVGGGIQMKGVRNGPGSSSAERNVTRRRDDHCEGESSSSSKGKKMTASSPGGRNSRARIGISITDSQQVRSVPHGRDNTPTAGRTRRPFTSFTRGRVAGARTNGNEASPVAELLSHNGSNTNDSSSSPTSSNDRLSGARPSCPRDISNARAILSRESVRRYNMDGIAEVLLALERIEQDDELAYELLLETNLILNGLNFFDQHRDMRLDIDNMTYEELLALEERIGSVSTALTDEELSECLKVSVHRSPSENGDSFSDDTKCSICQEEYLNGDEIGRLECEHRYHVLCIQQWFKLKNWCPVCKASASSS